MENHGKRYALEGKSAGGKFNALAHGIRASSLLLPSESAISFGRLAGRLHRAFKPVGAAECLLVNLMVSALWRLRRIEAAEVGLFMHYTEKGWRRTPGNKEDRPAVQLGEALAHDDKPDAFGKLDRYRTSAERQLLRAMRELRSYQAERKHGAPQAIRGRAEDDGSEIIDVSLVRSPRDTYAPRTDVQEENDV